MLGSHQSTSQTFKMDAPNFVKTTHLFGHIHCIVPMCVQLFHMVNSEQEVAGGRDMISKCYGPPQTIMNFLSIYIGSYTNKIYTNCRQLYHTWILWLWKFVQFDPFPGRNQILGQSLLLRICLVAAATPKVHMSPPVKSYEYLGRFSNVFELEVHGLQHTGTRKIAY